MTELALVLAIVVCAFTSGGAIGWYLRDLEDVVEQPGTLTPKRILGDKDGDR